ncbi:MAG: putative DNA binding domain-containing protein [Christensenellaceae bacterium]|jgi:ATP-dependent DNA helicase RecG|nr:putative DNA binding domain-containing protein [Christensenellaceae bacterium]
MSNNHATIEELLVATEGEHIQFKEAKNRFDSGGAARICCALANRGGGKLVMGISDKRPRKVVGSTAFDQPERTRKGLIDKLHVMVDFEILESESKRVLVFNVASRPVGLPVQVDGIAWWYEADSLIPMPEDVRRGIYAENGFDFSGEVCRGATLTDLDEKAISAFRKTWATYSGNKRIATLSAEQLLRDCDAITDTGVTYAALILFGTRKAVRKYLPRSEVIFEYRSSEASGPAAQREEFTEGFFNYNDRIWELVNLRNDKQHYQDGMFVFPIDTFNERVVREALLNAISHRDYQLAGSVFVRQYRDKLVIESPGGFPYGITVDNILDRQSPRNLLIAKIFQLCGLVERSGQGMNLIYELAVREAKALPDFKGTDAYFVKLTISGQVAAKRILTMFHKIGEERLEKLTTEDYILISKFYNKDEIVDISPEKFAHLAELGIVEGTKLSEVYRRSIGGQSVATTDRKIAVKNFIQEHGEVKTADLVKAFGLSDGYMRALLREMATDGTIEKVGDRRYTSYKPGGRE